MKNYFDTLKNVELFNGIEENSLSLLLNCLSPKIVEYKSGQPVFLAGEKTEYVGVVLSGNLQISQDDYFGNRNILTEILPTQMFGEAFVCADMETFPISIFAVTDSKIMLLNYKKIITTCSNTCIFHNTLIFNMLRIIAHKNIMLTHKIEIISKRTTKEKLLAYLLNQATKAQCNSFTIPFNRQQLADYLSVDRSAMSAELCKLRDNGILKFCRNQFTLI